MVARSPPKQQQRRHVVVPPLNPSLLRETVNKVDQCMAKLQELQYAVRGGTKAVDLRKHEPLRRMRNTNARKSPNGKLPTITEEWRQISLPAMLLGETMVEIVRASRVARNIIEAVSKTTNSNKSPLISDPKTPVTEQRKQKSNLETGSNIQQRRKREKRVMLQTIRSEDEAQSLQRAKSRINFKVSSPAQIREECDKENHRYIANRVSPRNRPWVKKTVLFPNPLFQASPTSQRQRLSKTKSPVMIARKGQITTTPHKFLVKSPVVGSKSHMKIKSPKLSISPTRACKKSPKAVISTAAKVRRSLSPSRLAYRLVSSPLKSRRLVQSNKGIAMTPSKSLIRSSNHQTTALKFQMKVKSPTKVCKKSPNVAISAAAKLRRSLSPSRMVNRLMSPLKSRNIVVLKNEDGVIKLHPMAFVC